MFNKLKEKLANYKEIETAEAHCDGPCGVYDPAQARIEAESVKMLTKKILDLNVLKATTRKHTPPIKTL